MHARMIFAFLLVCALSFPSVSDFSISSSLDRSGYANLNAKVVFDRYSGRELSLYVSGDVDSVTARDASGLVLPVMQSKAGNYTKITVTVPTDYVELDVATPYLTSKSGSGWKYELSVKLSEDVGNFSAVLLLPADAKISGTNGEVGMGGGGLTISWSAGNFSTSQKASMSADYVLKGESSADYLPFVLAVVFVAGALAYLYLTRTAAGKSPKGAAEMKAGPVSAMEPLPAASRQGDALAKLEANAVFRTLDENDREIIREIMRQGGKTTQAQIYLYTHIPKATLSRRLASLESKGIIAKSQKGNRNLVTLGDAVK